MTLRAADWLGRRRGRLGFLNWAWPPLPAPRRPALRGWEDASLAAAWLGHATTLLRVGGMTILTDPVMSNRIGVGLGIITAGPLRLAAPALSIEQLPRIDLILLSHAHFDHLDRPTLTRLAKKTPVITASANADLVRDLGFRRVRELRWGESVELDSVRIEAVPVRHWGARTFNDIHRGYNGYLVEARSGRGGRVLFGGDTAYQESFAEVGRVDLAVLGIGGYNPYVAAHATPEQAWAMAGDLMADAVFPMHHSTFRLSHEPAAEPMERLMNAAGNDADRIIIRAVGDEWTRG